MQYRRAKTPGETYFFTIITCDRQPIFCYEENVELLLNSFRRVKQQHPFIIDACSVVLMM
jgi:putative transposase